VRVLATGLESPRPEGHRPAHRHLRPLRHRRWDGYLAVAHTRMATESAVTVLHSHPFVPARDLCVVHNGSFSNYATVRRFLLAAGVPFDSDNDSEVAARYLARPPAVRGRPRGGHPLGDEGDGRVLHARHHDADELSVVRDAFACKPAVVAETDGYVAVASEYRALAELPGIATPRVRAPSRGGLHVESLNCEDLVLERVNPPARPARRWAGAARTRGAGTTWPSACPTRITITVEGNAGYFVGGLCGRKPDGTGPDIVVNGFVGWSVGENLMGGSIRVRGSASQSAGASARGGRSSLRATPRCGPGSPSRAPPWPSPATPAP
jgi:hypothetical protein